MKNKRILYSLMATTTVIAPLSLVVSCGSKAATHHKAATQQKAPTQQKEPTQQKVETPKTTKTPIVSGKVLDKKPNVMETNDPKEITKTFGEGNIANQAISSTEPRIKTEFMTRHATGQPFSIHYHMRDLVKWEAGEDTDDAFGVSTVPLQDRVLAGKILATQKDKQLDILGSLSENTADTQMGTSARKYSDDRIFQMWSKVTSFVGWGGSTGEGNFIVPKGDDINAAHRNGVPLLGTLFLAPNAFGGNTKLYEELSQKNADGTYPIADSMVAMANHFGFDGWFLNFESQGPDMTEGLSAGKKDSDLMTKMKGFMKYFHDKMQEQKLFTVLYDYMEGEDFMKDPSNAEFDKAAIDFSHRPTSAAATKADPTKGLYGLPVDKTTLGYNYDTDVTSDQFKYKDIEGSNLWLYTYFKRHDIADGDKTDLELFSDVDGSRDPRSHMKADGSDTDPSYGKWNGLSKYFQAHTVLNSRKAFSTSFETGIGSKFYIGGEEQKLSTNLAEEGYRNQGLQDLLPTYTWISDEYNSSTSFTDSTRVSKPGETIVNDSATWNVKLDETGVPFYGSSNLHYTGKISAGQTMVNRLYGSQIPLKTDDKFSVVVDTSDVTPDLALWTQDKLDTNKIVENATKTIKPSETPKDLGNGLSRVTYSIPSDLDSKTLVSFGLAFTNKEKSTKTIDIHVGQLSYNPEVKTKTENKMVSIKHDGTFSFMDKRNVRINWEMQDKSSVDHYVIWNTDKEFVKKSILSVTSLPAAYLKDVGNETNNLNIIIDAVGADNEIISSNQAIVKASDADRTDKSKWSEKFERPDGKDAKWDINTGKGYVTSFKDVDGNIYASDKDSDIFKISKDGGILIDGNDSWGEKILDSTKDGEIIKIWSSDDKNISVLTSKGEIQKIDKNTGAKVGDVDTKLVDYIGKLNEAELKKYKETPGYKNLKAGQDKYGNPTSLKDIQDEAIKKFEDKNVVNEITSVQLLTSIKGETILIAKTNIDGLGLNLKISGSTIKEIPNQTGPDVVKPMLTTLNSDGSVQVIYTQNGNLGIKKFASENDIDFSSLTATKDITDKLKDYTNSDDFKNLFGGGFIAGVDFDKLATAKIIYSKTTTSGDTLLVNEWGIAIKVDKNGAPVSVVSLRDSGDWVVYANSVQKIFKSHWAEFDGLTQTSGANAIMKVVLDLRAKNVIPALVQSIFGFDEKTNTLTFVGNKEVEHKTGKEWLGQVLTSNKFDQVDLTDFIKSGKKDVPKVISSTEILDKSGEELGSVVFAYNIHGLYVVGGSTGKMILFDKDFAPLSIGHTQYVFNKSVAQEIETIYDNGDTTIPEALLH